MAVKRDDSFESITKFYKIRRNFSRFWGLIILHTPENNRVSKEKRCPSDADPSTPQASVRWAFCLKSLHGSARRKVKKLASLHLLDLLADVIPYRVLPSFLSFKNKLNRIAQSPLAPGMGSNVMCLALHFSPRIFHRDRHPTRAHRWQIDHIVSNKRGLLRCQSRLLHNLKEATSLVIHSLVDIVKLQIAGAPRHGFRCALGNQPSLDAANPRQRNRRPIVRMKPFELDLAWTGKTRSALCLSGAGNRN